MITKLQSLDPKRLYITERYISLGGGNRIDFMSELWMYGDQIWQSGGSKVEGNNLARIQLELSNV